MRWTRASWTCIIYWTVPARRLTIAPVGPDGEYAESSCIMAVAWTLVFAHGVTCRDLLAPTTLLHESIRADY